MGCFRQASSHYLSQCWQNNIAILCHSVLSNCHNINGDSRITDPFVGRNHRWQAVLTKIIDGELLCLLCCKNNMLNKQSSCPRLKMLKRQCHLTVLTTCHFQNVVRPHWVNSAKYFRNVNCLAAQVTLAIINFNFTIQRWEIIHDQFV